MPYKMIRNFINFIRRQNKQIHPNVNNNDVPNFLIVQKSLYFEKKQFIIFKVNIFEQFIISSATNNQKILKLVITEHLINKKKFKTYNEINNYIISNLQETYICILNNKIYLYDNSDFGNTSKSLFDIDYFVNVANLEFNFLNKKLNAQNLDDAIKEILYIIYTTLYNFNNYY